MFGTEKCNSRYGRIRDSGSLRYMHEWGSLAVEHVNARFKSDKLVARAKEFPSGRKQHQDKTHQLWDPAEPPKITNSAEVSVQEKYPRCGSPQERV